MPLRVYRIARGMSIVQLSEASGVSSATIWRSEKGRTRPNRSTAKAIASALDCSVDALFPPKDRDDGAG